MAVVEDGHWIRWHERYDDPSSSLSRRLAVVQRRLREALDNAPPGPVRLISMCAGQGRDVIGVLTRHRRQREVCARLVEIDHSLAQQAKQAAAHAGLASVEVVEGDASTTSAYAGAVPADVVLVCGVFGNVSASDIRATVHELRRLTADGATVIWTRHRRPPDLTPAIRGWFTESGFDEVAFDTEDDWAFGVGTNRLAARSLEFRPERRMFTFVGDGSGAHV